MQDVFWCMYPLIAYSSTDLDYWHLVCCRLVEIGVSMLNTKSVRWTLNPLQKVVRAVQNIEYDPSR